MTERKRVTPGETEPERSPSELAHENLLDAAEEFGSKPPFLEYIDGLTQAECESREVWIYRLNADGTKERQPGRAKAYLEIVPLPLDSDGVPCLRQYIADKFGGGRYEIFLKIRVPGQRQKLDDHHTATFDVGGPPKTPAATTAGPSAMPGQAAVINPAGTGDAVTMRILDKLDDLGRSRADDPLTKAAGKVMDKALENFVDGPEKPAGFTGNPTLDTILAPLIARALTPPPVAPAPDPFDTYLKIRNVIKEATLENAPPAPPAGRASELVELVKAGGKDAIELAKAIYGNSAEPGGLGAAAGEALTTLIRDRPQAIGQAWDLITHAASTVLAKISGPVTVRAEDVAGPQPANGTAALSAPATQAATQPANHEAKREVAAESGQPAALGMPPQAVIDDIFGIVVRNFQIGLDGTTVGIIILGAFPKMQPFLQMVCAQELEAVLPELRQQPAIAPILDDPRFPEFYTQFREMCQRGLPTADDFAEEDGEDEADTVAPAEAAK